MEAPQHRSGRAHETEADRRRRLAEERAAFLSWTDAGLAALDDVLASAEALTLRERRAS